MRRKYFTCARNSACEVAAAIDLAIAIEALDAKTGAELIALAARLRALLVGLLR